MRGWWRADNSEERFWANVQKTDGCWLWTGYRNKAGYGRFRGARPTSGDEAPKVLAHRFSYELANGPIATGLVLDHLCRNPQCVNPAHLEAVPQSINCERGLINGTYYKDTCANGHEYTPQNTRVYRNGRVCRTCQRFWQSEARKRKAEKQQQLEEP